MDGLFSDNKHPRALGHRPVTTDDILVDPKTFALTSTANWSRMVTVPFGEATCILDQLLGWEVPGGGGWQWVPNHRRLRIYFWLVFQLRVGWLTQEQKDLMLAARTMGLFFRFGPDKVGGRQSENYAVLDDIFSSTGIICGALGSC